MNNPFFKIDERILTLAGRAEERCRPVFEEIDRRAEYNAMKVLSAFGEHRVSESHFAGSTGYGYGDIGRDTLDAVFAQIVGAEDALVRHNFVSGTHALTTALFGVLRPGDVLLSLTGAPYDTMEELIAYSQANPQTVKIAANTGATSHWASVVLNVEEDAQLNIVNASSSAERVANLLGGQLDVIINPIGTVQDYVTSGDFKYLAVTTSERLDYLPDVPTCLEQGVNLSYDLMYYVMFPKGTDPAICQKFAQAFKEISEMPEYAEEIKTAYNQTPYFLDTEESIAYIQEENEKMMAYADYFK